MSKLFTASEVKEIERRKKKDYTDKYGLFSRRIRPKIVDILSLDLEELKYLIQPKNKRK